MQAAWISFHTIHCMPWREPLYDRVQDVLLAHDFAGEKQRVHIHYLKGSIFCDWCGSRLSISDSRSAAAGP